MSVYLNIDTGSANTALPASSCVACPGNFNSASATAACSAGTYSLSCECHGHSANISAYRADQFLPCNSPTPTFACPTPYGVDSPCLRLPGGSGRVPGCTCMTAGQLRSIGVVLPPSLSSTQSLAVDNTCYGDNQGFLGLVVDADISLGSLTTRT